jgi:hypothetical protein
MLARDYLVITTQIVKATSLLAPKKMEKKLTVMEAKVKVVMDYVHAAT